MARNKTVIIDYYDTSINAYLFSQTTSYDTVVNSYVFYNKVFCLVPINFSPSEEKRISMLLVPGYRYKLEFDSSGRMDVYKNVVSANLATSTMYKITKFLNTNDELIELTNIVTNMLNGLGEDLVGYGRGRPRKNVPVPAPAPVKPAPEPYPSEEFDPEEYEYNHIYKLFPELKTSNQNSAFSMLLE